MPGARVTASERVTLRTFEREDVEFFQRAHADPALRLPLGWTPQSRAELEDASEETFGHEAVFLACLDGDDAGPGRPAEEETRPVGCVFYGDVDRGRPGIGYWLVPEVHGEGYGKESVSLLLDYVFDHHAHPAVYAKTLPTSDASRGLLESLGFSQEGRLRKADFWEGEYRDVLVYGLLRDEWRDRDGSGD